MEGPRPAARRIARRRLPRLRVVLLFALVLALGVELLGRGVFCLFIRPILADELPKLRRAGAFRVLCLGDSHTLGIGAEWTTESYPVRLEEALRARHPGRPIAVSRVGISGFNSAQVLIFLRAILEHYPPPDLAIVLVGGNNQYSFWHARFWPDLLRTPTPKNVARYLASHSMLASVAELVYINLRFGRGPGAMGRFLNEYHYLPPRVQADWLAADYAEMIERLRRAGSRVVLLTYPSPRMPVADREAKATAARLGVPCLDLRYFRLSSGQAARLLNPDGHPNAAGYQRMADLVAGFLDARGLLADAPAEAGRATPGTRFQGDWLPRRRDRGPVERVRLDRAVIRVERGLQEEDRGVPGRTQVAQFARVRFKRMHRASPSRNRMAGTYQNRPPGAKRGRAPASPRGPVPVS